MDRNRAVEKLKKAEDMLAAQPGMYGMLRALLEAPGIDWASWSYLNECDKTDEIISYFKCKLLNAGGQAALPGRTAGTVRQHTFWQSLQGAQLDGRVLKLVPGTHFFGSELYGDVLIVQRQYEKAMAMLWTLYAESQPRRRILLAGSPGIGKTTFRGYLAWQVVMEAVGKGEKPPAIVVLERREEPVLFASDGSVWTGSMAMFQAELEDPKTWFLVDAEAIRKRSAMTVLTSSQNPDILKAFSEADGHTKRFFGPCDADEMEAIRAVKYSMLSPDEVKQRHARLGGRPRAVLELAHEPSMDVALKEAVERAAEAYLATGSGHGSLWKSPMMSDILLDMRPVENMTSYKYEWVSLQIELAVVDEVFKRAKQGVKLWMMTMQDEPWLASLHGRIFERLAHPLLVAGGTFVVRNLVDRVESTVVLHASPGGAELISDAADIHSLPDDKYFAPVPQIYGAVDSGAQPSSLFQFTVSLRHPVKSGALIETMQHLRGPEKRLYFVLPADVYVEFGKQTYTQPTMFREDLADVTQYALRLEFYSDDTTRKRLREEGHLDSEEGNVEARWLC